MGTQFEEMVDVEEALHTFKYLDLYNASINFFKTMGYPIIASEEAINVNINQLAFYIAEKHVHFSFEELEYFQSVDSISYLFKISNESEGLNNVKIYNKGNVSISSIVFLAVELKGKADSRSFNAYYLTQVLNKCYYSPVFILFRHNDAIMFASQIDFDDDPKSAKVFLSDWYSVNETDISCLYKLSEMFFSNLSCTNFLSMFFDMVWLMAREYYIDLQSHEYLKYGLFLNEFVDNVSDGIDDYSIFTRREKALEYLEQERAYYKNIYGDDYITENEQIDIMLEEDEDWALAELDEPLMEVAATDEEDYFEDEIMDRDEEDFENDENIYGGELDGIDESYFDDPIKLLEYIERNSIK